MDFLISQKADTTELKAADFKLEGLYEPPPVEFTFETIGWSILAGLVFLAIGVWMFSSIRQFVKNKYRREALAKIKNSDNDMNTIWVVLKQVAIYRFGRREVADLTGKDWLSFLEHSAADVEFLKWSDEVNQILYEKVTLDESIRVELVTNAKKWIKNHA